MPARLPPCLIEQRVPHADRQHPEQHGREDRMRPAGDSGDSRPTGQQGETTNGPDPRIAPLLHIK
jgi:hypothetical protein